MTPGLVAAVVSAWVGATLVLADRRWFRRRALAHRLSRYGPLGRDRTGGPPSVQTMRDILAPVAVSAGASITRAMGIADPIALRLRRAGDDRSVADFRLHQAVLTAVAFVAATGVSVWAGVAPLAGAVLAVIAPSLTFLVVEQQITTRSRRHQDRLGQELAVIVEQWAMLLRAGYSMTGAIRRLAERANGATASDLATVLARIQQGLSVDQALTEWSDTMGVDALDRVVAVAALDRDVHDIGPLLNDEARAIRLQSQRRLIESIERRNEQVWIPVTVAALVPGMVLLAIPFVDALRTFSVGP